SSHNSASSSIRVGPFNPANPGAGVFEVGTIAGLNTNGSSWMNGDIAFTASGRMVITSDSNVYIIDLDIPTVAGTATLTGTLRGSIGSNVSNGIAFGYGGNLFISVAGSGG